MRIERALVFKSKQFRDSLEHADWMETAHANLALDFMVDTFNISERNRLYTQEAVSTLALVKATLRTRDDYDRLLNKLYVQLTEALREEDRELLRQSQRQWIRFRDNEVKLSGALTKEYYSGGGSIQVLYAASRVMELTKNRVLELYHYLSRKG